ncbi:MAG: hybrid sensor histidine kinase/response regulator, partial [Bacteroidota bacterium]
MEQDFSLNRTELLLKTLAALNEETTTPSAARTIVGLVKEASGFEAVAIRLREGEDFPYAYAEGHEATHLRQESSLLGWDDCRRLRFAPDGKPVLECICGAALCGRTQPALLQTPWGSLWTNRATAGSELRNTCVHEGYQTLARIPIKDGAETVGLLQLDDRRVDQLSPVMLESLELVGQALGNAHRRIQASEALRGAKEAADREIEEKSRFLAAVGHEIRNPLGGIIGMTELAMERASEPEQRELLSNIKESAASLKAVLNDLLDFSKLEAQKFAIDPVAFDLRKLLPGILSLFAVEAHRKGLTLALETGDLPDSLLGDPVRIRQILVNLLGTAVKFTHRGGVTLYVNRMPETLRFTVKDTGIGIPPEKQALIWEAYRQSDSSVAREYGGTGLGLSITKHLVELMNGTITLESAPGKGSTFEVTLPFGIPEEANEENEEKIPPLRILVAEDNPVNQKLLRLLLEKRGHEVSLAQNGEEALMMRGSAPFELMIVDLQMPLLGGLDVARRLRSQGDVIP